MIIHPVRVQLKLNQQLYLIPFGDLQSDSERERLEGLVQWCLQREKEGALVRLFGLGDYFETFSPSERAALRSAKSGYGLHDTTKEKVDDVIQAQADDFVHLMKPLKGRIIGLLKGHHKHDFFVPKDARFGLTTDEYICHKLSATYFGTVVVLKLLINGLLFTVFATHGYGSARTKGARLNKRLRMRDVYLDANWYVMGHDNEKIVDVDEPMFTNDEGIFYKKQYFSGSGSFQRSYDIGKADGGYAEEALYPPSSLGVVICTIQVVKNKRGKYRLDYHVSA